MGTNQSQSQGLKEKPVPAPSIIFDQTSKALKGYTQSFEIKIKNN